MTEGQSQGQRAPEATADTQVEAQPQAERSFTQADLKKIAANEKREGKQSAINELLEKTGAESLDDVLSAYSEFSEIRDAASSEAEKANAKAERAEKKAKEAEANYRNTLRTWALQDALRVAEINPARIKAALRLADLSSVEVAADGSVSGLEDVIEQVREEAPEFFMTTSGGVGTGQGRGQGQGRVSAPMPGSLAAGGSFAGRDASIEQFNELLRQRGLSGGQGP